MGDALPSPSGRAVPCLAAPEGPGSVGDRWHPVRLAPLTGGLDGGDPQPHFTSWFVTAGSRLPTPARPAWLQDRLAAPAQALRPSSQAAATSYRKVSLSS